MAVSFFSLRVFIASVLTLGHGVGAISVSPMSLNAVLEGRKEGEEDSLIEKDAAQKQSAENQNLAKDRRTAEMAEQLAEANAEAGNSRGSPRRMIRGTTAATRFRVGLSF